MAQQQARLQQIYREKIVPELMKQFGYKSIMEVPRLTKITLNMGVSEAVSDKKVMDHAVGDLTKIAGQKPVVTMSKKPIAGFKIRENMPIGCMVTLRGVTMTSAASPVVRLTVAATTTWASKSRSSSRKSNTRRSTPSVV